VNDQAMFGTAQLPKFQNDQFSAISLNLFDPKKVAKVEAEVRERTLPKKYRLSNGKFVSFRRKPLASGKGVTLRSLGMT
jgi:hypothetical protein